MPAYLPQSHRLAVYDVHKRCIRETVQLLDSMPVRTSFYYVSDGMVLSGSSAPASPKRQQSAAQQVRLRRQARNTYENAFRVFRSAPATGSSGEARGPLGTADAGTPKFADPAHVGGGGGSGGGVGSGDAAVASGEALRDANRSTNAVQNTLYMLSAQRLRCVRAQDWDAKIHTLLQSTMEQPSDTAADSNNAPSVTGTAVDRATAMHFAWAEALAIAATHYERHNKHDNEFSQARVDLLTLARR